MGGGRVCEAGVICARPCAPEARSTPRQGARRHGHPSDSHRAARSEDHRAGRVRRHTRLLLREFQRPGIRGKRGAGLRVRAGQPFALDARRAARPPLPDRASAGQAGAGGGGRGVRRGGGSSPEFAALRQVGRGQAQREELPPAVDSARLRARLRGAVGVGRVRLQGDRLLVSRIRAQPAVERPDDQDRLADRAGAAAGRQGRRGQAAVRGRVLP